MNDFYHHYMGICKHFYIEFYSENIGHSVFYMKDMIDMDDNEYIFN